MRSAYVADVHPVSIIKTNLKPLLPCLTSTSKLTEPSAVLKRPGGNLKERSPVGNGCMGGRLGAKKSGAVAIQNWNCSITSYSDHAPHPSSPLAIFGHQSFLDICTRCREKGRAGGEADQLKDEILVHSIFQI